MKSINIGDKVKCKITGFEGIAVARSEFIYGCIRITILPQKLVKGEPIEDRVFDEEQLKIIKRNVVANTPLRTVVDRPAAGPRPAVSRR